MRVKHQDSVLPLVHYRKRIGSAVSLARQTTASACIGPISKDYGFTILTNGTFSMIDAIRHVLRQTGPANLCVTTWVPGTEELIALYDLKQEGSVLSLKFLLDYGFAANKPERARLLLELFGADCVVETRNHAKVVLIRNEEWDYCLRGSLNLNGNTRCENLDGDNDAAMCETFACLFDDLASRFETGLFRGGSTIGAEFRETMIAPPRTSYGSSSECEGIREPR